MKIAIVAADIWRTVHLDIARALRRLGHDVVVYTEDKRARSGSRFLRLTEEGVDFWVISDTRRNAWTWVLDKLTKPLLGRRFFTSLVAIARFLRAYRSSDLILVEGDWMGYFVGLCAIFMPMRWVVEIHDTLYLRIPIDYPGRPRSRWREWVKRWVLKQATGIRANSEVTRTALIQGGCPENKIFVLPLHLPWWIHAPKEHEGQTFEQFRMAARTRVRASLGIGNDESLLTVMCRLDPVKGLELAVEALGWMTQQGISCRLMICGGDRRFAGVGSYQEQLARLAAELKVSDRVLFTGNIDIHEVKYYLAAADLHLAPSVMDTFNYAVAEAALVGTYSLMSDKVGAAPWISGAGSGEVIEGRDPAVWGAGIQHVLREPPDALRLQQGSRRLQIELAPDVMGKRLMLAIEESVAT